MFAFSKYGSVSSSLAKHNIEKNYLLVGLTEDLENFFYSLEKLRPALFAGAHNTYLQLSKLEYIKLYTKV